MEQRLISLLESSLHPDHLKQIHAIILTSHPNLTPHFYKRLSNPATIHYARQLFDKIPHPDPLLSNSVISALTKLSFHKEALQTFFAAHSKQTQIAFYTVPLVLKSCAASAASAKGRQVHSFSISHGYCSNMFVQTGLVDFYAKTVDLDSARRVFDEIVVKEPVPYNCLISGYSKAGNILEARQLFDEMPVRTHSSWNSMISSYSHSGQPFEALRLFGEMLKENVRPNEMILATVLSVCAKLGDLETGLKVKKLMDASEFRTKLIVRTAVLEMYVKCGAVDEARMEFDQMDRRDIVAWSAMIAGYAQNGRSNEALELFEMMRLEKLKPNEVTLVSVLSACGQLGSVEVGERIGTYVEAQGFVSSIYVASALLDMYCKCGHIRRARQVFDGMHQRDVVTWNSMIGGLAINGLAEDAIDLYHRMKKENFKPNDITFVGLLTACTHAGLVDLGLSFFNSMKLDHGILPKIEHYACIVDLFCKSGRLHDAYEFICRMELEPNVVTWGTLLSACRIHSNVELAERAVEKLVVLEPDNSGNYVLLCNLYADSGRWEEARKVRNLMKSKNIQKSAAYSWIDLDGTVHRFLVGDKSHPQSDVIFSVAVGLGLQLKSAAELTFIH